LDYFITFGPASFDPLEAYGGMIQLSDLIKKYLHLCSEDLFVVNESLTVLDYHEGE